MPVEYLVWAKFAKNSENWCRETLRLPPNAYLNMGGVANFVTSHSPSQRSLESSDRPLLPASAAAVTRATISAVRASLCRSSHCHTQCAPRPCPGHCHRHLSLHHSALHFLSRQCRCPAVALRILALACTLVSA